MYGDFSRPVVPPLEHTAGLLHQQGRVWLDADWNEDVQARLERMRLEMRDIIGACGAPTPGGGFQIGPSTNNNPLDFHITAGHYYVQGILCQLDKDTSYLHQPDYPNPDPSQLPVPPSSGRVRALIYLEAWHRLITHLEDNSLREVALGGPDTATRLQTVAQVKVKFLSEGEQPSEEQLTTCDSVLPQDGHGTLTTLQSQLEDVLPDDLCHLADPATYTGQENHLYRVEIHDAGDVMGSGAGGFAFNCPLAETVSKGQRNLALMAPNDDDVEKLKNSSALYLIDDDGQSEAVRIQQLETAATSDLTRSTAEVKVVLEDALTRTFSLEKHATLSTVARFKWSRDNAAFGVHVEEVMAGGQSLRLESLGRDYATALQAGSIVEISDDASDLGFGRGHLTYLSADPNQDELTVSLAHSLPDSFSPDRHLKLRKWDGIGLASAEFNEIGAPGMNLGDGVRIQFSGYDLRPGDFWQFRTRSADGTVEALTNVKPMGMPRYRCPLYLVHWDAEPKYTIGQVTHIFKRLGPLSKRLLHNLHLYESQLTISKTQIIQIVQDSGAKGEDIKVLNAELRTITAKVKGLSIAFDEQCRQWFDPLTKQKQCGDCTVMVAPDDSLEEAIDKLGRTGGVVCLSPGVHRLHKTVDVEHIEGLTLRGAGAATIIQAPTESVALRFHTCQHLTIRDLTVVGGQSMSPDSPSAIRATAAEPPRETTDVFEGVVTMLDCGVISVTGCTITSLPLNTDESQSARRACIAVIDSNAAADLEQLLQSFGKPNRLANLADLQKAVQAVRAAQTARPADHMGRLRRARAVANDHPPTSSTEPQAEVAPPVRQHGRIDFTLRDCRLYADAMQSGLVIAGCLSVSMEDTWIFSTAAGQKVSGSMLLSDRAQEQIGAGFFGLATTQNAYVNVTNSFVVGFNIACIAQDGDLTLRGTTILGCRYGLLVPHIGVLQLDKNRVRTDAGPAVLIGQHNVDEGSESVPQGKITLTGNNLISALASNINETTSGPEASVSEIFAETALISSNRFYCLGQARPFHTVAVVAHDITYNGNQSTCESVPLFSNVTLMGLSADEHLSKITALANVCREKLEPVGPFTGNPDIVLRKVKDIQNNQAKRIALFMRGDIDITRFLGELQQLFADLKDAKNDLSEALSSTPPGGFAAPPEAFPPPSLRAMAAVVVVGCNVLTATLLCFGSSVTKFSNEGGVF